MIGLVHAFILFALIQALAIVSGAHFNPAVTAAMTAIRQIRPIDAAIYIAVPARSAASRGALVVKLMFDNPTRRGRPDLRRAVAIGTAAAGRHRRRVRRRGDRHVLPRLGDRRRGGQPARRQDWAGFAIGATLGAAVMIFGPVSGAGLNPARAFGPALVGEFGEGAGTWILIWVDRPADRCAAGRVPLLPDVHPARQKGEEGMEPVG